MRMLLKIAQSLSSTFFLLAFTHSVEVLSMSPVDSDVQSLQIKLINIVSGKSGECVREFLTKHAQSINLNTCEYGDNYPLDIAVEQVVRGCRGADMIEVLIEFGAQLNPDFDASKILWANILHNAISMKRFSRLSRFLEKFQPEKAVMNYLVSVLPNYSDLRTEDMRQLLEIIEKNGCDIPQEMIPDQTPVSDRKVRVIRVKKRRPIKACLVQ